MKQEYIGILALLNRKGLKTETIQRYISEGRIKVNGMVIEHDETSVKSWDVIEIRHGRFWIFPHVHSIRVML